ncbi:MAG: hypothetical protein COB04_15655 [Gammaproteobacteria bacterium]|nr:MAG: hypothetical protein COB04_15655 [Gammaproteobacteria bacterium]
MTEEIRDIPKLAPHTTMDLDEQYWAHCAEAQLHFQKCDDCGSWRHLPRYMCSKCGSANWQWAQSSGKGEIYSWTITHQALLPFFKQNVPYASIIVEMEEGVRMVSGLKGMDLKDLELGLKVEVHFEDISGGKLPIFYPAKK